MPDAQLASLSLDPPAPPHLPPNVLHLVFRHLTALSTPQKSLPCTMCVCRTWREAASGVPFWEHLSVLTTPQLKTIPSYAFALVVNNPGLEPFLSCLSNPEWQPSTRLSSLTLRCATVDKRLTHSSKLTGLRELVLPTLRPSSPALLETSVKWLSGLTALTKLRMQVDALYVEEEDNNRDDEDYDEVVELSVESMKHVACVTGLQHLSLQGCENCMNLFIAGGQHIFSLTQLTQLCLTECEITLGSLPLVSRLTNLKALTFKRVHGMIDDDEDDTASLENSLQEGVGELDMDVLLQQERACFMSLNPSREVDRAFDSLAGLTKLESLKVHHNALCGQSLRRLRALTGLTELELVRCVVETNDLAPLSRLVRLRKLDLSRSPKLTTGVARYLLPLPNLDEVYMGQGHFIDRETLTKWAAGMVQ